ncbi:hypothetical protein [Chryseobacterium sp. MEBOG07]|uniref:hypothetical protein n=1 Tax=Chryseobacterium sp. MEBOG07 TaxID=2879939 RepID=UPI001F413A54|nr:hypothetical protein [Chryseobacterium sp. MEBOG07]UKB80817.1 hypothetical protein LF886_07445 [Chryseobacterium sp. MEBOG07]
MMAKEPYYTIDFTAVYCKFEVLVNDIPVIAMETEGQMSPNVPVNFGISSSGEQKIEIKLLPVTGGQYIDSRTKFEYTIKLFDVFNDKFVHEKDCGNFQFSEKETVKKLPSLHHKSSFQAEIPYEMMKWEESRDLLSISKDTSYLNNKLDSIYKRISSLIESKQYDAFFELIKNREKNMALSMYLGNDDAKARLNSLLEDFNDGFKIMPLPEGRVLKIYGNGKLATYKKLNGEPAFFLFKEKTKEELMLELMFHIPQGKEEFEVI